MADMMEKPLDGAGLEVLWGLIKEEDAKNAKIATGSYTGTGSCGSSSPNTLTFSFKPKFVLIYAPSSNYFAFAVRDQKLRTNWGSSGSSQTTTWLENGLQWYDKSAAGAQMNTSGWVHAYIAIG